MAGVERPVLGVELAVLEVELAVPGATVFPA